jgi:putative transcriptional regulator
VNNIDELRKKKGLSYKKIAAKAGVSGQYIWLLAKGKRSNPSLKSMQKIAAALGETVDHVFQVAQ